MEELGRADDSRSHPRCHGPEGHTCSRPSGRTCVEDGCGKPAGTLWGPFWCPDHDEERLDRITEQLERAWGDLGHRRPNGSTT